jgi:putative ABC transport system permease protein
LTVIGFWAVPARVAAIAAAVLGALALALSAIGIYGMMACAVSQRTREIGIRIALGARPHDVLSLVVGAGARLTAIGLAGGLIGAFITTRFLRGLLGWVDPLDPVAFGAATALLTVVALIASYLPARRATSVDPIVALRTE